MMFMRPCDTLDNEPLYKNKLTFTFHYEDSYDITLISRPKRFDVHLTQTGNIQDYQTTKDGCAHVLETICDTLDNVISQIKHLNPTTSTNKAIYLHGFKCPILSHFGRNDLILNKASNTVSDLSRSPKLLWYNLFERNSNSCFQYLYSEETCQKMKCLSSSVCHGLVAYYKLLNTPRVSQKCMGMKLF